MLKLYFTDRRGHDEHKIGHALAEYAIRLNFAGTSGGESESYLCRDSRGKPGVMLPGAYVSISHSGTLCAVAVSDGEVGVDIEAPRLRGLDIEAPRLRGLERLTALAKRYFSESELAYFAEAPECNFYRVWCAKESYIKYTGNGLSEGLRGFSVVDGSLGVSFRHFKCASPYNDESEAFGCVCTNSPAPIEFAAPEYIPINKFHTTEEAL